MLGSASNLFPLGQSRICQLRRESRTDRAAVVTIAADDFAAVQADALRSFGENERTYWQRDLAPRRRQSFLLGRVAARRALHLLGQEPDAAGGIGIGVFGQPVVHGGGSWAVSIAHSDAGAAAVAFPAGHPLALDLEFLQRDQLAAVQTMLTTEEHELVKTLARGDAARERLVSFILWSAREAVSKVLGCGLVCSGHILTVKTLEADNAGGWRGEYSHLGQWAFAAVAHGEHLLALVHPKRTALGWE
ncbi:MAG: 4'-phosphopantetheinyl transferase superfamily protein [Opitutae bacterium]|nr:4'-phosphopantetheinyl transferase superfamily protein [Opitutae bacterium]